MALKRYNVTLSATGTGTFTVPPGCVEISAECHAGGGGTGQFQWDGAGGGAMAVEYQVPVTPGETVNYQVGAGGVGNADGQDSWFKSTSFVLAKGGKRGSVRTGGQASQCVGDGKFSGGDGGLGKVTTASNAGGGGGAGGVFTSNGINANGANALSGTSAGKGARANAWSNVATGGDGAVDNTSTEPYPDTAGSGGGIQGGGAGGGGYNGGNGIIYLSYLADLEAAPPPADNGTQMFFIL